MNVNEYINYFEDIARNLKAISHNPENKQIRFVTGNIEELLGGLRSKVDTRQPVLIIYNFEGEFHEAPDEELDLLLKSGFVVLQHVKNENDFKEQNDKSDALLEIVFDILSKMRRDRELHAQGVLCPSFICDLDFNTIKFQHTQRLGDNAYGWFVEFDIVQHATHLLDFNEEKWH